MISRHVQYRNAVAAITRRRLDVFIREAVLSPTVLDSGRDSERVRPQRSKREVKELKLSLAPPAIFPDRPLRPAMNQLAIPSTAPSKCHQSQVVSWVPRFPAMNWRAQLHMASRPGPMDLLSSIEQAPSHHAGVWMLKRAVRGRSTIHGEHPQVSGAWSKFHGGTLLSMIGDRPRETGRINKIPPALCWWLRRSITGGAPRSTSTGVASLARRPQAE